MPRMQPDPRPATPNDLHAIEDIVQQAYSPYVARIGRVPGPMLDDYGLLIGRGRVHVVERDGAVQDILVLIPERDTILLDNVAVARSAQGSGLGRALLESAEQSAKEAGYTSIRLYTNETMTENIGLYRRIGYRETHRAEEKGLKRVHMRKALV